MASSIPVLGVTLAFLDELVLLFAVSVVIAYVCYRLHIVPIAGFLIAGVVIGPGSLGIVKDIELVNILAEVGVILLLFTIGLEFSLDKLARLGRAITLGGGSQVGLTVFAVTAGLAVAGTALGDAFYTGCLVALSSTAIVLGLLSERDEMDTPTGRLSLAILIFQDLAVIAMVLLVPILSGTGGSRLGIMLALLQAIALVAVVLILARRVVPWILDRVARTRRGELFLLTVVTLCFGTAALTSVAGVSLALGAFLAGLVVSESHYRDQALADVLPLRTVFNAVFFVSVGMLLDASFVISRPLLVLGAAGVVVGLKFIATAGSVLVLGYPLRIAAATAFTLAQIGEFSFVLERTGRAAGLTPAGLDLVGEQVFIAVTVLLMVLTPFMVQAAPSVGSLLTTDSEADKAKDEAAEKALEDHTIVIGYGPAGQRLATVLQDVGVPFVVVEMDPENIDELREKGIHFTFGDASRQHILESAGVESAKLCVIVIHDPFAVPRIIRLARYLNPTLQIIVRTRALHDIERLHEVGADIVVPEEMETTIRIFTHVLGAYLIKPEEVDRQIRAVRAGDYRILRGSIQEAHLMVLEGLDEEGLHTRAVAVRDGAPAAGQTLTQLALRRNCGITVIAVRRGTRTMGAPAGDFRVEPGDRLVLIGTADQFAAAAALFRDQPTPPVSGPK